MPMHSRVSSQHRQPFGLLADDDNMDKHCTCSNTEPIDSHCAVQQFLKKGVAKELSLLRYASVSQFYLNMRTVTFT